MTKEPSSYLDPGWHNYTLVVAGPGGRRYYFASEKEAHLYAKGLGITEYTVQREYLGPDGDIIAPEVKYDVDHEIQFDAAVQSLPQVEANPPKVNLAEINPAELNPKDLAGARKAPISLLPSVGVIYGAMAAAEGASKYGPYNWRDSKIAATIYIDAIKRHLIALEDGEDIDRKSSIHHMGHIIAGAAIYLDAMEFGNLIDDRRKSGVVAKLLDRFSSNKS